jgi:hypothetical protein
MSWRSRAIPAFLASLLVGGLVATPATAAVGPDTTTAITTPADPAFFNVAVDPLTGMTADTVEISGTATPDVTQVDIDCLSGDTVTHLANAVPVTGSAFAVEASLQSIWGSGRLLCHLRAIPSGVDPTTDSLVNYVGPRVLMDGQFGSTVSSGPNTGTLDDYFLHAQLFRGAFDYHSLGNGGVTRGFLFDQYFDLSTVTFFTNATLFNGESHSPTRSELQIDGANAYTPSGAETINPDATGLPALSYSYSLAAATHDLVIHETDPLVRCSSPTYPPTAVSCPTFVSAGVTDHRTITQDHDGHISWIGDVFTSTDGHAHSLDLLWENDQRFFASGSDTSMLEYEFPGQSSFAEHVVSDTVALPASAPGTILVRMSRALDGDPETGRGAIVYDRPAASAKFENIDVDGSDFVLHQTGTVPAGGTTTFRFAYVHDFLAADVASLAQTASSAFLNTLTVSKSGTGSGTVTSSPGGINCGSACSHGFGYGTSVTLAAAPSVGSTFAGWSGACSGTGTCKVTTNAAAAVTATFTLQPETLTVTRVGDGAGTVTSSPAGISCGATCSHAYTYGSSVTLTAQAAAGSSFAGWSGACSGTAGCSVSLKAAQSVGATFLRDCVVPKVTGKTLKVAKRALAAHACRLGRVGHAFSKRVMKGRVISQKPKPGRHLAHGAKVALVLSKGKP